MVFFQFAERKAVSPRSSPGFIRAQNLQILFTDLGKLKGDMYTIYLQPNAKCFSLGTARNISLPLETTFKRHSTRWKLKVSSSRYISQPHGVLPWLWQAKIWRCKDLCQPQAIEQMCVTYVSVTPCQESMIR